MLCQNCKKNKANVKYTEIINGEKTQIMLCDKCSYELGIDDINFNMPIDFSSFLGGILEEDSYNTPELIPFFNQVREVKCENCNMTYDEFINKGKFGCANCYDVFSNKIDSILKRIHGSNEYLGRKYVGKLFEGSNKTGKSNLKNNENNVGADEPVCPQNKLEKLQKDLKKAIQDERYEDAAKIRDEIKLLENK